MIDFTSDPVFIDTNVPIYTRDHRSAEKRRRARRWLAAISESGRARTNLQVPNELTRRVLKNEPARPIGEVQEGMAAIGAWGTRPTDETDTELAWSVRLRHGYQWFDCLLLAAACDAGRSVFLTEDMAHGATFENLTLIDPFRASPDDVLRRT